MLRRKGPEPESTVTPASILAAHTSTVGRFDSEDDVILAGSFEGKLRSSRSVQLLAGSRLKGDVLAAEIVVHGMVTGNLLARERIRILQGGSVSGDVCAPQVTVQEGVELNGRVRMLGSDQETREYLLPVLLRAESGAAPRQWQELLSRTEEFLETVGFLVETRAKPGMLMRSIFRTREPMTYAQLRTRMDTIDTALGAAIGPDHVADDTVSAAALAQAARFLEALGDSEGAVGILGSSVVQVQEVTDGAMRPALLPRSDVLHASQTEVIPRPGDLLLELQRIHGDVLGESVRLDGVTRH